jgi:hypothetical protein
VDRHTLEFARQVVANSSDKAEAVRLLEEQHAKTCSPVGLRDQFAMAALQGMIASCPAAAPWPEQLGTAEQAYGFADAMLKAREV